jgi:bifunctional DNA-binding transcriptional regulator/antitoxin component of YhaV-PrlF toxin-antitoxin module
MGIVLLFASMIVPLKAAALASAPQANAAPSGIVSLSNLRGQARPLLIFAPKPDDPQLEIQLRRLHDNAAAVSERDVVPIAIPFQSPSTTAAMLSGTDAQAVRRRFNVAPGDFEVILIGKDGGEKLRSSKPISMDKLRETIDSMPMRQQEVDARKAGGGTPSAHP